MKERNHITLSMVVILILLCISIAGAAPAPGSTNQSGTVLAVYMIGSDLEYDPNLPYAGGAASNDITEMVTGYGSGSPGFDILVAYGGSTKEGWKGITIANPVQLKEDIKDGKIGVNASYLMRDESINMGDKKTIVNFLKYVAEQSPGKRILVVFWDHGAAWDGFGMDANFINPNTGKPDLLSLEEISSALKEVGYHYDFIGFDACLMANLEVVSSVAPYGNILVASEEIEPGFGWDWTSTIKKLVDNPSLDARQLGTSIVDSYLTNPSHNSEPKTLSVIDLNEARDLSAKFNAFSKNMGDKLSDPDVMKGYENALLKVQAFGTYALKSGETFEYTVDMKDYLEAIKKNNPGLSSDVDPILEAIELTIVYSREDGSRPNANGLSIYSPYTAILVSENKVDPPPKTLLDGFMELLEDFIGELKKDTRRIPDIIEDKSGYLVPENASVTVELTFIQNTNESMIILGTEPAYPDKPGRYPFPKWGGWGLMWKEEQTGKNLVVPVKFMGSTPTGRERYEAYGKVTRDGTTKSVRFDFYYEPHTGDVSYYITPYSITGKATPIFERTTWKMQPGDKLTMLATHRVKGSGSEKVEEYGSIDWTDSTKLGYGMLPCGYSYTIIFDVYDVARKSIYQDYNDIEVPCLESETDGNESPS